MGARTTLNGIYVTGALVVAALFGSMTESWLVFVVSLGVLVGMKVHSGAIRPNAPKRRK
jgi:hypothetical protein